MSDRQDAYYLRLAFEIAQGSRCVRAQYGSVLVSADGRIISTGYNGKPRKSINDHICYREGLPDNAAKPNCCLHSEHNCLLFSDPVARQGGTLYVSGIPCTDCALSIAQSGVARLVYYAGPAHTGHFGNFDLDFYMKYGMTFEVVSAISEYPDSGRFAFQKIIDRRP